MARVTLKPQPCSPHPDVRALVYPAIFHHDCAHLSFDLMMSNVERLRHFKKQQALAWPKLVTQQSELLRDNLVLHLEEIIETK